MFAIGSVIPELLGCGFDSPLLCTYDCDMLMKQLEKSSVQSLYCNNEIFSKCSLWTEIDYGAQLSSQIKRTACFFWLHILSYGGNLIDFSSRHGHYVALMIYGDEMRMTDDARCLFEDMHPRLK